MKAFSRSRRSLHAFTFVEVMIATAVVAIALGAVLQVNSIILSMSKGAHDTNAAMLYNQERIEQLRDMDWPDMISGSYYTSQYFNITPASAAGLSGAGNVTETVTVEPYPAPTGANANGTAALVVVKAGNAAPQVVNPGSNLSKFLMARVRVNIQWMGEDGRTHQHESDTLISSSSGITSSSLPAMGAFAGGTFDGSSTTTTTTTTSGSGTTTTTTGNNGNGNGSGNSGNNGNNGNGNGNVGGKSGKG